MTQTVKFAVPLFQNISVIKEFLRHFFPQQISQNDMFDQPDIDSTSAAADHCCYKRKKNTNDEQSAEMWSFTALTVCSVIGFTSYIALLSNPSKQNKPKKSFK